MNEQAYRAHVKLIADEPSLIRACDLYRLLEQMPPSFDRAAFLAWLTAQPFNERARQRLPEIVAEYDREHPVTFTAAAYALATASNKAYQDLLNAEGTTPGDF